MSKLTKDEVYAIKNTKHRTTAQLAADYHVSPSTIVKIKSGARHPDTPVDPGHAQPLEALEDPT